MNGLYDEFRVALHNVWQRRWLALAVAWGVCLLGWLIVSMIPNNYQSEARVFVQMQSLIPEVGTDTNQRKDQIDRIQRTLTSTENLEKVVRGTQLAELAASPRAVTDMALGMRESIKVLAQQENLFQITASANHSALSDSENARLSRAMVQKLIDIFVEENLRGSLGETNQSLRFLDDQLKQRELALQEAEAKRVAFEQKYMGLLPGVGSVEQRMAAARQELNQVESNLLAAQSSLAALNGQLASTPPSITGPGIPVPVSATGGPGAAGARASQLEGQMAEAQSRGWTENHPDMISLRSQLNRARAAAAAEGAGTPGGIRMLPGTSSPNPMYTTLRTMQAEKSATAAALGARKAQLQAELAQFAVKQIDEPSVAAEQQRLNRDYEVLKTKYDELLAEREKKRLLSQVQSENGTIKFRVIDPPSSPRKPTAPDRPLLLTGVLIAGLLSGIGAAFAKSQLQTTYTNAPRLEKASGLPVIGSISEVLTVPQKVERARKMKFFFGGAGALAGAFALLQVIEMIQRGSVA
jgi:polysaccharide biosynthesis transport protein